MVVSLKDKTSFTFIRPGGAGELLHEDPGGLWGEARFCASLGLLWNMHSVLELGGTRTKSNLQQTLENFYPINYNVLVTIMGHVMVVPHDLSLNCCLDCVTCQ